MPRKRLQAWQYANLSPTQRCYRWLEAHGYEHAGASGYNANAGKRWDTFGFVDFWAYGTVSERLIAIQTTSGSNHASHRDKIKSSIWAPRLLKNDIEIWLMTWSKLSRGWTERIETFTLEGFDATD